MAVPSTELFLITRLHDNTRHHCVCWCDLVVHHDRVSLPGDGDPLGPEQLAGPQPGLVLAVGVKQRHALVLVVRHRDQTLLWGDKVDTRGR